jgi:hypothetical protein
LGLVHWVRDCSLAIVGSVASWVAASVVVWVMAARGWGWAGAATTIMTKAAATISRPAAPVSQVAFVRCSLHIAFVRCWLEVAFGWSPLLVAFGWSPLQVAFGRSLLMTAVMVPYPVSGCRDVVCPWHLR